MFLKRVLCFDLQISFDVFFSSEEFCPKACKAAWSEKINQKTCENLKSYNFK
jgi:hypothetical protein